MGNILKVLCLVLVLSAAVLPFFAQVNGDLKHIGNKAILHVWGSHYERGHAQGYLIAEPILDVFDEFFWIMFLFSDPVWYQYLKGLYTDHFDNDPRIVEETQGLIQGIVDSGASLYHAGLQRDLDHTDFLFMNAFLDMQHVSKSAGDNQMELGCSSLSSWGISTAEDDLLQGTSVITRWLDWSLYDSIVDNPLVVIHHPSEPDEQKWLSATIPGIMGAVSAVSEHGVWASLNLGNDHSFTAQTGLNPILLDIRRGVERFDYNQDGLFNIHDVTTAIQDGSHLSGSIIHTLSESQGMVESAVVETNNSGTVLRYYDHPEALLRGQNLAATNHFRALTFPSCCSRYAAIRDSLDLDHRISPKRQWTMMVGAAGQNNCLAAFQYIPSLGTILWASASSGVPAYENPAIELVLDELFSFSTAADDPVLPTPHPSFSLYPNPVASAGEVKIKSGRAFDGISVHNIRGQLVFSQQYANSKTQAEIALPSLPAGVYLLRLSGPSGLQAARKLVLVP
ncbi:MAG: T9SS type A sorting domain-containing protein [Candidatus Cloacimonetes bacterium]|nr:T9SS type A sorting domain-containing protein [Candidatus Cloacimonadota bacterium]